MKQESGVVEAEFLSTLYYRNDFSFDLLQIKPNYLQNPKNRLIMEAILSVHKQYEVVGFAQILQYSQSIDVEYLTDVLSSDNLAPITYDCKKQFMIDQSIILENHKKNVISNLSLKLSKNEIDCTGYLKKMSVIQDIKIQTTSDILTENEIIENISTENNGITLPSFSKLNAMLKLVQGDFLMIGASTGVGKSGLLLNFMNDLMEEYQCIYFNMEMSKSTIYKRMVSIHSKVPIEYIDKPETEYQRGLIGKAIKEIADKRVVVEHKATYLDEIKNVLKMLKNEEKHTIVFLDHIGLIRSRDSRSQYEQMTEIAKQLRQICLDYDCTIISACQLNRSSYNSEELSLSMLKDSGELENSSSKVILLYRDKEDKQLQKDNVRPKMVLEIVKNRDGMLGQTKCKYDKTKQIFEEIQEWN